MYYTCCIYKHGCVFIYWGKIFFMFLFPLAVLPPLGAIQTVLPPPWSTRTNEETLCRIAGQSNESFAFWRAFGRLMCGPGSDSPRRPFVLRRVVWISAKFSKWEGRFFFSLLFYFAQGRRGTTAKPSARRRPSVLCHGDSRGKNETMQDPPWSLRNCSCPLLSVLVISSQA